MPYGNHSLTKKEEIMEKKTIEDMMVVDFTIDFIDYLYVESLRA